MWKYFGIHYISSSSSWTHTKKHKGIKSLLLFWTRLNITFVGHVCRSVKVEDKRAHESLDGHQQHQELPMRCRSRDIRSICSCACDCTGTWDSWIKFAGFFSFSFDLRKRHVYVVTFFILISVNRILKKQQQFTHNFEQQPKPKVLPSFMTTRDRSGAIGVLVLFRFLLQACCLSGTTSVRKAYWFLIDYETNKKHKDFCILSTYILFFLLEISSLILQWIN